LPALPSRFVCLLVMAACADADHKGDSGSDTGVPTESTPTTPTTPTARHTGSDDAPHTGCQTYYTYGGTTYWCYTCC
jgi:hypothetical protein